MKKETLTVQGMTCQHCVMAVKKGVGAVPGVSTVDVNLSQGLVVVESDESVSRDDITVAIEDAGYDVV